MRANKLPPQRQGGQAVHRKKTASQRFVGFRPDLAARHDAMEEAFAGIAQLLDLDFLEPAR
ncbi:hypothetical protein [Achromobacter sp. RTa]|uniref:hypothetical protein n=1 Tax=Achromobacter sp. RTa TaxID=1532557 RepID=UPI0012E002EE|nr:hypothetical protein [Achromobacter sp. RTa]